MVSLLIISPLYAPFAFVGAAIFLIGIYHLVKGFQTPPSERHRRVVVSSDRSISIQDLARKADSAMRAGKPNEAISYLHKMEDSDLAKEEEMAVLESLGKSYSQIGNFTKATEYLKQVIELVPHRADLNALLAVSLAKIGRIDEADKALEQAISLNPELPIVIEARTRIKCLKET